MTAAELAERLPGARRSGMGYVGRCPAHDDRHASLSWRDGDRGRLLVTCHAGCTVDAIAAALGLSLADFRLDGKTERSCVIAEYEYRDAGGTLLYVVERRQPKTFRQRRPDGAGGWTWTLTGVPRVPYRLPELRGHRTVYISEGEKDADRLWSLRLPATTNAGGAGKWTDALTAQLHAAGVEQVVVLPDNDRAGEAHARSGARSCLAAGLRVKVVRLPGLPAKGDVSDWLDAGHTREELAELVRGTPETEAASVAEPAAAGHSLPGAPVLRCLADVVPESIAWLWPGRIARGKLTLLVGDPAQGKSTLLLDIAARVTTGTPWPDGEAAPRGAVVLLSAEDGLADTVRPRLDALGADVAHVHALCAVRDDDGSERPVSLDRDLAAIEAAIVQTGAVLVGIDPLSAYLGETNSYKDADVRRLLAPLVALAERYKVAIVGVMHLGKDAQRRAIYRALGSIAFAATARLVLAVTPDPGDDARRLVGSVKNNIGPRAPTLAFRLDDGRLAWDADPVPDVDFDSLLSATPGGTREEPGAADRFLANLLAEDDVPTEDVFAAARAAGISERSVRRAKARLGYSAYRLGGPNGKWYWTARPAPDEPPKAATYRRPPLKAATSPDVAAFNHLRGGTVESTRTSPKAATSGEMAAFNAPPMATVPRKSHVPPPAWLSRVAEDGAAPAVDEAEL